MPKPLRQLVSPLGASAIASACLIGAASLPSKAIAATTIQIPSTSVDSVRVYTSVTPTTFVDNNPTAAIAALQDNNLQTNVELWYQDETPDRNVGFSITNGGFSANVTSVTATDWGAVWKNGKTLGEIWFDDLLTAYNFPSIIAPNPTLTALFNSLKPTILNYLNTNGFPRAGDPNVAAATVSDTGLLELTTLGFKNLKAVVGSYSSGDPAIDTALTQFLTLIPGPIAISEVARVVSGGQTYYAYSFSATDTGFTTTDGTNSFTGKYTWQQQLPGTNPDPVTTPEPLGLLGLAIAGGALALKRRPVS